MPTYIDKDKLMNEFIEFVAPSNRDSSLPIPTWNDAVSLLGSAPDADVEAVVRCKDCNWADNCKIRDYFWTDNDFCSKGIRRESK